MSICVSKNGVLLKSVSLIFILFCLILFVIEFVLFCDGESLGVFLLLLN